MAFSREFVGRLASPLVLIVALLLWQLVFRPKMVPKSHYEVLGVKPDGTTEAISHAYKQLSASWNWRKEEVCAIPRNIIEIQHAYAILSHPLKRRDYDHFGVDEIEKVVRNMHKGCGNGMPDTHLLWDPSHYEPLQSKTKSLTLEHFKDFLEGNMSSLIQIYSLASKKAQLYASVWEQIATHLDGVAKCGMVELGEVSLVALLAEKNRATGYPFFRYGLPALVAFPPDCKSLGCILRYSGEMSIDSVVNWMATRVLRLPRILYYSSQTLVTDLIQKSGPHKVKVVIFSTTGERAAPFLRQLAKVYWQYAVFGLVLWREENATFWNNMLGVDSAPAFLLLKDPGVQPVIHYGNMNSSTSRILMEQHKTHVLPQLRTVTAAELGCDETGYSRAGKETSTWYCVIVAGRPGLELSQMRGILREVQNSLRQEVSIEENGGEPFQSHSIVASAFKAQRLTLAWLDGETQKQVCYFYLHSETVYETCGPKRYQEMNDVPKVFLVRYKRQANEENLIGKTKHISTFWNKMLEDEEDLASQIVARYNGSMKTSEIADWISEMIREGDYNNLPFYKRKAPALVPEESKPAWFEDAGSYVSRKSEGLLEKIMSIIQGLLDYAKDPKFTPLLVLIITLYVTGIFFRSNKNNRQDHQTSDQGTSRATEGALAAN